MKQRKSNKTTIIPGELEIDNERGVIYFHATDKETLQKFGTVSILRICSLPKPIPKCEWLDITHMHGTNWNSEEEK